MSLLIIRSDIKTILLYTCVMFWLGLLIVFALAACSPPDPAPPPAPHADIQGWQMATGKPPSKAEFAALLATCEDKAGNSGRPALEDCLVDYGLRRSP